MVELDIRNSRMMDFYDIWFMANTWTFDQGKLGSAIAFSFARRGMAIPSDVPFALTEEFLSAPQKAKQWKAFLGRLDSIEQANKPHSRFRKWATCCEHSSCPVYCRKRIPPWLSGRRTHVGRPARRENDWLQHRCFGYRFGYTHQFGLFTRNYAKLRRGQGLRLRPITVDFAYLS